MAVSVVMAVHNGQEYLREAVESVLLQTYTDLELIIVNDASTDKTGEILERIADERVTVIHLAENRGAAAALNLGIEQAKGDWIAIHDADDISYPNRIERQMRYLQDRPGTVAVGSFIECISGRDHIPPRYLYGLEQIINRVQSSEEISEELYQTCHLTHGTMLFSKKTFMELGQYDPNLKISYDYDLWTRLVTAGRIEKIPEKLYKYRLHGGSLTKKNPLQNINEMFYISAKYIRRTCYKEKRERPVIAVFGCKVVAGNYVFQARGSLNVVKVIDKKGMSCGPAIVTLLNEKKLDGVVILSKYKKGGKIFKYLKDEGLEPNKNLFLFWARF